MNQLSAQCAKIILQWHQRVGAGKAAEVLSKERLAAYRATLEKFVRREEQFDESLCVDIADCQISGNFELFYAEQVPAEFLKHLGTHTRTSSELLSLGDVAKLILVSPQSVDTEEASGFELPEQWEQKPPRLRPTSKNVRARNITNAVEREFGETLGKLRHHGLGGMKLLVALHKSALKPGFMEDQTPTAEGNPTPLVIYSPASFNLQLASGPETLVEAVVQNRVKITKVVAGVDVDWADSPQKEW
jgi:hypothetical protein